MNAFRTIIAVIAATSTLLASAFASAATISITDLTDGTPTVALSGFPPIDCGRSTAESLFCVAVVQFVPPGPTFEAVSIGLFEDAQLTQISDAFFIQFQADGLNTDMTFIFQSDKEVPLFDVSASVRALETGLIQPFNLQDTCPTCPAITVNLTSDLDRAPVPEPATLVLVGLGLAVMELSRRRHLRKS